MSHVMQWGDLSYQSDTVGSFVSGKASLRQQIENTPLFRFKKEIKTIRSLAEKYEGTVDSRTMKLRNLVKISERENSVESSQELREEMESMQSFDMFFSEFQNKLSFSEVYNSEKINFECLRASIDTYESRCQKFTDYGMIYMKNFASACESH